MKRQYLIICATTCIFISTAWHAEASYNCCDACRAAATSSEHSEWLSTQDSIYCTDNFDDPITPSDAFTNQDGCAVGRCTDTTSGHKKICRDCQNFTPPTPTSCVIQSGTNFLKARSTCNATYYKCQAGYYGTPSDTVNCKICPAHATCQDGNFGTETFTCDSGYAKNAATNATKCIKCPENSECGDGTTVFKCKKNYYLSDDATDCIKCPTPGINGGANRSSITSCYLYKIDETASTNRWYDATGYFNVTQHCYYSTTQSPQYPVLGIGTPSK